MLEYTENVAYNTSISLTFDNETQVKTKTLQLQMLAASRCALAILLAVTTEVTQISLMVWVALGKHQIAQQLVEHPCSMRFEKQTSVAENSFDCCWCARCTKKRFRFPEVASSMQIVFHPSQGAKVFRPQFHQVSVQWMQDMRQRQ